MPPLSLTHRNRHVESGHTRLPGNRGSLPLRPILPYNATHVPTRRSVSVPGRPSSITPHHAHLAPTHCTYVSVCVIPFACATVAALRRSAHTDPCFNSSAAQPSNSADALPVFQPSGGYPAPDTLEYTRHPSGSQPPRPPIPQNSVAHGHCPPSQGGGSRLLVTYLTDLKGRCSAASPLPAQTRHTGPPSPLPTQPFPHSTHTPSVPALGDC